MHRALGVGPSSGRAARKTPHFGTLRRLQGLIEFPNATEVVAASSEECRSGVFKPVATDANLANTRGEIQLDEVYVLPSIGKAWLTCEG
jgi:hypothetical protein